MANLRQLIDLCISNDCPSLFLSTDCLSSNPKVSHHLFSKLVVMGFKATGVLSMEHFNNADVQGRDLIIKYGAGLRSASDLASEVSGLS